MKIKKVLYHIVAKDLESIMAMVFLWIKFDSPFDNPPGGGILMYRSGRYAH